MVLVPDPHQTVVLTRRGEQRPVSREREEDHRRGRADPPDTVPGGRAVLTVSYVEPHGVLVSPHLQDISGSQKSKYQTVRHSLSLSLSLLPGALVVPGDVGHHTLQVQLGRLDPPVVQAMAAVSGQQGGRLEHTDLG